MWIEQLWLSILEMSVSVIREVSHVTDDSGVFDYVRRESGHSSSKKDLTKNKDLYTGLAALAVIPLGEVHFKRTKKISVSSSGVTADSLYNRWKKVSPGSHRMVAHHRTKSSIDREKSVIATLLVITLLFLIGTFPQAILRMIKTTQKTKDNPVFQIVRVLSNLSELLNASLNFYIYCLCNTTVRSHFWSICTLGKLKAKWSKRDQNNFKVKFSTRKKQSYTMKY